MCILHFLCPDAKYVVKECHLFNIRLDVKYGLNVPFFMLWCSIMARKVFYGTLHCHSEPFYLM